MTTIPSTANFTMLTISNNASAKLLLDAMGFSLTNKKVSANFLSLKVNDVFVASLTNVDNSAVATYSQAVSNTNSVFTK